MLYCEDEFEEVGEVEGAGAEDVDEVLKLVLVEQVLGACHEHTNVEVKLQFFQNLAELHKDVGQVLLQVQLLVIELRHHLLNKLPNESI